MAGRIFFICRHPDTVLGVSILININSGTDTLKRHSWVILMLAMKKNNMLTLSFHDISQYLNLTLSSSPISFSSGPHFVRTLEEPEIKLPTFVGSSKKQESSRKTSASALSTMPKPLTVWITINCGEFQKRWKYQTTWPASWEICMQVRKRQLELDMEQQTGSKSGKEYVKAVYCPPAYLIYMQRTSWETLGQMKHKLESRLLGEISITSDMQMIPLLWQKMNKN